jgi:hypothetical protein
MAYEMFINAQVGGTDQLQALGAVVDKDAEAADRFDAKLKQLTGSNALMSKQTEVLNQLLETSRMQLNLMAEAAQKAGTSGTQAFEGIHTGATRATGSVRNLTNEMRMMEGAMPIRAAAQFLSQIEGLAPILQAAFPIFGAIALVGVLDQIIEKVQKWVTAQDPLAQAQTASLFLLKESSKEYDRLREKLHALTMDEYERAHGRDARLRLEASEQDTKAQGPDAHNVARLENYARVLREIQSFTPGSVTTVPSYGGGDPTMAAAGRTIVSGTELTERQASMLKAAGMEAQLMGDESAKNPFEGISAGNTLSKRQIESAQNLLTQGIGPELETARMRQKVDAASAGDDRAKADAREQGDRRGDAKEARDAAKETREYIEGASNAFHAIFGEGHGLTALQQWTGYQKPSAPFYAPDIFGKSEEEQKRAGEELIHGMMAPTPLQMTSPGMSPEDAYRAAQQTGRRSMSLAGSQAKLSGMTGQDQANQRYQMELDMIAKEEAALDRLGKKKDTQAEMDERRLDAELEREQKLLEIAEKQKAQAADIAGSFFDALRGHSTNRWGRNFMLGQARTVFSNVAGPAVEDVLHMTGATGGATGLGDSVLKGTIFDKGNSAVDITAKQTTRTAVGVENIIRLITGKPLSADGTSVLSGSGTGSSSAFSPFSSSTSSAFDPLSAALGPLPMSSSYMAAMSPLMSSVSAPTGAGAQFMSGLGSPATALAQLLGVTPPAGTKGYGSDGTPHDAYGNPISVSTATQIGQGLSVGTAIAMGTMSAIKDFSKGGAGGDLGGAASVLGMAAMIPGPQMPFVAAAAAITGMIGGMLTNGPQQRSQQIQDYIAKDQYLAPTALNVTQGMNGTYEDFDARGNLRTSNLSAIPTVTEPYITKRTLNGQQNWYDAPGSVVSPFSGSALPHDTAAGGAPSNVIVIQAIDAESLNQALSKPGNAAAVANSVQRHLQSGSGESLAATIRFHS